MKRSLIANVVSSLIGALLTASLYGTAYGSGVQTSGNISASDKVAWSENAGWVNLRPDYGGVLVRNTWLSGYAWAENLGWIKLGSDAGGPYVNSNASDWGVNRSGAALSGYAWSETSGWINFNPTNGGVTIDAATGSFDGFAWSENAGWIHFKNASPAYKTAYLNAAPVFNGATVISGAAAVGNTLSLLNTGTTDTNGDTVTLSYQWYLNGNPIENATGSTFTVTSAQVPGTITCTITADDGYGGSVIVATAGVLVDNVAPVLILSTLADGSITNNASLNVSGTVTDNVGIASLLVGNVSVTVNVDNSFSHLVTLQTGTNTITTSASDASGNQALDTRSIILDQTGPALTVASPADNSNTNQASILVAGVVETNATVQVKVNDAAPAAASVTGTDFTFTANLASGVNTIEITVCDPANNTTSVKRTITYDAVAPSIGISEPNQDSITDKATLVVKGTVSDELSPVSVILSEGTHTYTPAVTSGKFEQAIVFPDEGAYKISATATDEAGNSCSVRRNIHFIKLGDLDASGDITVSDAFITLKLAVGLTQPTNGDLQRGDVAPLVDGKPKPDGKIDLGDVVVILRKAVGLPAW